MEKAYKCDTDSPLFTLASVLNELLKDVAHENVPAPAWNMSPEKQVPYVDLEISSEELDMPPETKQPMDSYTPNQPTVDHLTQELARSTRQNEEYTKWIAEMQQENKDLRLQVKFVKDLNKDINSSHNTW